MHVTAAGYLCVAVPLFPTWLAVLLLYDRMTYATFGRGQLITALTIRGIAARPV